MAAEWMGIPTHDYVGEIGAYPPGHTRVRIGARPDRQAHLPDIPADSDSRHQLIPQELFDMKRKLGIVAVLVVALGTVTGVSPAHAAQNWRCTITGSFSDGTPPYSTHWRAGSRSVGSSSRIVYWLHEKVVNGQYRFDTADRAYCDPPLPLLYPVVGIQPQSLAGQPACTSPGTFSEVKDGKIATHYFVGQVRSYVDSLISFPYTFRFWHVEVQHQPGVWTWEDSILARC